MVVVPILSIGHGGGTYFIDRPFAMFVIDRPSNISNTTIRNGRKLFFLSSFPFLLLDVEEVLTMMVTIEDGHTHPYRLCDVNASLAH